MEPCGIKALADPLHQLPTPGVERIHQAARELHVSLGAAAVFGRAGAVSANADRIGFRWGTLEELFDANFVLPTITEVILVIENLIDVKSGEHLPLASPEEAKAYDYSPEQEALVRKSRSLHFTGDPEEVRHQIESIAEKTDADQIMITSLIHDHRERLQSYELLADVFNTTGC